MIYIISSVIVISLYLLFNTFFIKINKTKIIANIKNGFRFIQISDIHGTIRFLNGRLSSIINRLSPDFVVVTGDLSNNNRQLFKVLRELDCIKADNGIYMVLGNYEGQELIGLSKVDRDIRETIKHIKQTEKITLLKNEYHYKIIHNREYPKSCVT